MRSASLSEREYSRVELLSPPQRSLPQTNFNMRCEHLCTGLTVQLSLNLYLLSKLLKSIKIVYCVCVSGGFPDMISHPFIVNNPHSMRHKSLLLVPLLRQHDGKSHCTSCSVREDCERDGHPQHGQTMLPLHHISYLSMYHRY